VGAISGRVFTDHNGNGLYDTSGGTAAEPSAVDVGIANVTVSAYTSAGALAGSATSGSNGIYNLGASGTGPYRVEFTGLPAGDFPSARSTDSVGSATSTSAGSTVQFVPDGNTTEVNLAVNRPGNYCQENPMLCSQLYGFGDSNTPEAVFTAPYWAGSTRTGTENGAFPAAFSDFLSPGNSSLASMGQVGTTFGLAYHRSTRRIFTAAFMKKHATFGPDGTGAIYQINRSTGAVSTYVNLNSIFGANTAGANPHTTTGTWSADNGQTTWNAVGKVAFGGMTLSADEAFLFVMNLNDRTLYRIPTSGTLSTTTIQRVAFPTSMPTCTDSGNLNVRPFAVTWHEGMIYVGAVCSNETGTTGTSGSTNRRAYVYQLNPTTMTFVTTPVLNFALNYSRLETDPGVAAAWRNWRTNYSTIGGTNHINPQAMLTDIDFDRGNMILNFRDRMGDQSGINAASDPNSNSTSGKGITAGDILRACGNPTSGWTLESNARCGGAGLGTQATGEGPGDGEYYYQDNYHPNGTPHDETAVGGTTQIPGHNVMVATIFDPIYLAGTNVYDSQGFRWFVNSTGAQNRGYLANSGDFAKANGMGNVIALCEAAPIEIGNRVWQDNNGNGVQDPGEPPLTGVTVRLYQGSTLVGTAITDANGEYYFVSSASAVIGSHTGIVTGGILANTAYQIRLDNPADYTVGGPLAQRAVTVANQATQLGDHDSSDSDAVSTANPAGSLAGTFPVVSVTTGGAGSNNHTIDIGLRLVPTAAPITLSGKVVTSYGAGIRNVAVSVMQADGSLRTVITGTFGYYRFDGIPAGQTAVVSVTAKKYSFPVSSLLVTLDDSVSGLNFVSDQ
jgi:protocatechuate 3,4-dioxygenase beta subunit